MLNLSRMLNLYSQVLDMWPYQVVRNWGHSKGTFVLDFVDSSYPVKTNQGKWMNELVDFHLEAILRGNVSVKHYMCTYIHTHTHTHTHGVIIFP